MRSETVFEHIMFHKALGEEVDRYMELYRKAETDYSDIKDEHDRSIAILFKLAIDSKIDPWDIDLVAFSESYLEKLRMEGINIVYAGRLILLAWEVLKLQSTLARERFTYEEEVLEDPVSDVEFYHEDLEPRGLRKSLKPVSVFDLLRAMEGVKGVEKRAGRRIRKVFDKRIDRKLHTETIKSKEVCEYIYKNDIDDGDLIFARYGLIDGMIALLHLARDKKIRLSQEDFPFGRIWIRTI